MYPKNYNSFKYNVSLKPVEFLKKYRVYAVSWSVMTSTIPHNAMGHCDIKRTKISLMGDQISDLHW